MHLENDPMRWNMAWGNLRILIFLTAFAVGLLVPKLQPRSTALENRLTESSGNSLLVVCNGGRVVVVTPRLAGDHSVKLDCTQSNMVAPRKERPSPQHRLPKQMVHLEEPAAK